MNENTLHELDDEQFHDEVGENVGFSANWKHFTNSLVIHRTLHALEMLEISLEGQLAKHAEKEGNEEWALRTARFKKIVDARLRDVRYRVRKIEASAAQRESGWKAFAHKLAEEIEDSEFADVLDTIKTPLGDLTAAEWLSRRREKRALQAVAA